MVFMLKCFYLIENFVIVSWIKMVFYFILNINLIDRFDVKLRNGGDLFD